MTNDKQLGAVKGGLLVAAGIGVVTTIGIVDAVNSGVEFTMDLPTDFLVVSVFAVVALASVAVAAFVSKKR